MTDALYMDAEWRKKQVRADAVTIANYRQLDGLEDEQRQMVRDLLTDARTMLAVSLESIERSKCFIDYTWNCVDTHRALIKEYERLLKLEP